MKVIVKTLDSLTHDFDVEDDVTVRSFKERISEDIGIEADRQRIIFKGKVLHDETILKDSGAENATVHVVERLSSLPPSQNEQSERQPQPTQQPPEPNDTFRSGTFLLGTLRANGTEMPQIADLIGRIVESVNTSMAVEGQQAGSVSSRIAITQNFINHARNIMRNRFQTENPFDISALTREIDNILESHQPNSSSALVDLSNVVASLHQALSDILPLMNLYSRFLQLASYNNENPNSRIDVLSEIYPSLPDGAASILHALSHSLHALSEILIYGRSGPTSTTSSDPPYRLITPTNSSEYLRDTTTGYNNSSSNRSSSMSMSGTESSNLNDQNQTTEPPPLISNDVPLTDAPQEPAVSTPTQPASIHFTVQVTTSGILEVPMVSNNTGSHIYLVGAESNPTMTANSSTYTPSFIRTTAASNGSENNIRVGRSDATSSLPADSRDTQERQPETAQPSNPESTQALPSRGLSNQCPVDHLLPCRSIYRCTQPSPQITLRDSNNNSSQPRSQNDQTTQPRRTIISRVFVPPVVTAPTERQPSRPPQSSVPQTSRRPQPVPRVSSLNMDSVSTNTTENWANLFSPEIIPVIREDVTRQKNGRKLPPLSNGYMYGTPDKKRKLKENSRVEDFVSSSLEDNFVRGVVQANPTVPIDCDGLLSAISEDSNLQELYNDMVNSELSNALTQYPDIEKEKYPNSHNFASK